MMCTKYIVQGDGVAIHMTKASKPGDQLIDIDEVSLFASGIAVVL